MTKFFKKSKIPYSGAFFDPFRPNLDKNEFSWEKALCQFLNISVIYHRFKNHEKLMNHSSEKCRTDGRIERRTDGQTDRQMDRQW